MRYAGDIIVHKKLKSNLPTQRVVGEHMYLAINELGDKTGEIWINDNSGELIRCAKDFTNEISNLSGASLIFRRRLNSVDNMNAIVIPGTYSVFDSIPQNFIAGLSYCDVRVWKDDLYIIQEIIQVETGDTYRRTLSVAGYVYKTWFKIATTGKIDISLPCDVGYSAHPSYINRIVKNSLKQGTIYGAVVKSDGTAFVANVNVKVATLPTNFLSLYNQSDPGTAYNTSNSPVGFANIQIYANGIYVCPNIASNTIQFVLPYEIA